MAVGRKQRATHEDFARALATVADRVSREELDTLIYQTAREVSAMCRGKRAAIAWSAGKDSLALRWVARIAGVERGVLVLCGLEFPAFERWLETHRPRVIEVERTGQNLAWLAEHPHWLFPQNAAESMRWFRAVQHRGQARYFHRERLDLLLLGRRYADGNQCGDGGIYTNREGVTRYSPLRSWSHDHVLAYLHYYRPELPPFYGWPRGFVVGTGPWAKRRAPTREQAWEETWAIDPDVVREAATRLPEARDWLARTGRR